MPTALQVVSPPERGQLTLMAGGKPVKESAEIAGLFPKREFAALQELKTSILANGQDGRCLYLDAGDHYLVIDGHDTSRAIAGLQREGREVEVTYDVYEPKEKAPEMVLLEVMSVAIRRKNLQTAQPVDEEQKKDAILRYLIACSVQGVHRTAAWVAEDLGCSRTWVTRVREQAIDEGSLPRVDHYLTRAGTYQKSDFYKPPFAVVKPVLGQAGHTVLEDEEEQEKARERAEAEARIKARDEAQASQEVHEPEPPVDAEQDEEATAIEGLENTDVISEDLQREADRFAEEMRVLNRWNAQRPKPFTQAQLRFLWSADLVDTDTEDVKLLVDRETLEASLNDLLSPILEDIGIAPEKVRRTIHNLLKTK